MGSLLKVRNLGDVAKSAKKSEPVVKRGRGRPRKDAVVKRGRGRPRINVAGKTEKIAKMKPNGKGLKPAEAMTLLGAFNGAEINADTAHINSLIERGLILCITSYELSPRGQKAVVRMLR